MLAVAYYLLKVIICSGILYGYYRLALHNKLFHRWNRFYLLCAVLISLSFPLIKINILHDPSRDASQVIKLLNVVTTGDEIIIEANAGSKPLISGKMLIIGMYGIVSLVLLYMLLRTLYGLSRLIKKNSTQFIYGIRFIDTDAKGTPFSFFRNIFWNNKIDIDSATGERIFKHELAHIQEKHSADKLFINIVLIVFWCNPFFWLIRREMNMIHEFIADSKAVEDNDTSALAAMIIQAAYPQHSFGLTSSFFSSSIKRRILMLTKMQNPSVHYISRVLVLPLLTIVFAAFAIKTKQINAKEKVTANVALEKNITVVIDAGHGGEDPGAKAENGTTEKDLSLAIAKKIQQLNTNPAIKIILTRETDVFQNVRDKVDWTLKQKPDAFISIHVNASPEKSTSGFDIYISREKNAREKNARALASILSAEISKIYATSKEALQRTEKGIWVLDAPTIDYPSVLIQCGYITNKNDLAFISNEANQEKIAKNILDGIAKYSKAKEENKILQSSPEAPQSPFYAQSNNTNELSGATYIDTIPKKIKSVDITRDDNVIVIYTDNKAVKMTKKEAIDKGIINNDLTVFTQVSRLRKGDSVIYILNGKEITPEEIKKIDETCFETINILKSKDKKADIIDIKTTNGVVKYNDIITIKEIELSKPSTVSSPQNNKIEVKEVVIPEDDKIFQKVETEAQFPGGEVAWTKYISHHINKYIDTLQEAGKTGTCLVQFIVNTEGSISNVEALTLKGTKFSEVVVEAIAKGPKWIPAKQNGRIVKAYRKQPVTFQILKE
ncbi:MAG: N-acetylmuramoyl-L-alanine amidase [Chitinophagaceae bacterium]|nr:N-acetylmuramoyl-L-alanine amidase [Chitinophagaceae bacterium]